uniref:L-type lectin-like domain-containing protein n=1 Tax=Paramoeba aestuarina TaxID=180227 RepID=A0A7S4P825_9EUKA|mmetsp:Transcript_37915/g.59961  ORF Transcript_37915/g.59961 Transcript_37915/m.59961 type:complete len:468 (+) Transcript_37915:170-1573(+)|eukprot:CAMPEP_0201514988 /NCGR_PEP_ID=MMETSP0161_2-20130828/6678_1 /ASSEMBLY_ACC=CAM_ASM_000251 /TAXON_ID=180227 /ORGANISM="Neoparamoeba aestuarina, Strain SoJaBio B1-5/56/2" /LENGTH=467 /DNA_ID=CAMNT_0047911687 /DNA_START=90 /DNA_END=1493 /DNA_ORIENTATION=+
MASYLWAALLVVVSVLVATEAHSDEFGRNPQHDFGSVVGRKLNPVLPFWTMQGDAFANEDFVRLTPDRQSKTGAVWNSQPMLWENWEVLIQFNVNGVSKVGADGLAWWLVKEVNVMGKFFGFRESFHGIGVVVDTYDNDGSGNHPSISFVTNDGTKTYSHAGTYHANDMELGRCTYPVRSTKENTVMKITHSRDTIRVELKREGESGWKDCIYAEDVFVDPGLFMGLTAATGHLADNHDVHGITVRNLDDDAKFMDSETKYAQFSKYTVAESLSRIQSDIRGALYETSVTGAKPSNDGPPPNNADVARQLNELKRDLQSVVSDIQQQQPAYAVPATTGGGGSGGLTERKIASILAPLMDGKQDVISATNEMRRNSGDLSQEAKKLGNIARQLEQLIQKVEHGELNELESKGAHELSKKKYQELAQQYEEESGWFSVGNIFFFILCIVCAYLGFTLYRIQKPKQGFRP